MKVLQDTNVIVSAVTTRGLCADVFRSVLADHEPVTCPEVLQEVKRILRKMFAVPDSLITEYLELLREEAIMARAKDLPVLQIKDIDDIGIIGAALSGKADVLVTGDREVQDIKRIKKLRIVSPRAFWEELTAPPPGGSVSRRQRAASRRGRLD